MASRGPDQSRNRRLGRGLAALIGDLSMEGGDSVDNSPAPDDVTASDKHGSAVSAPIDRLEPNPRNPRKSFSDSELTELANSVAKNGIIQPILVRRRGAAPDCYEIIAGERRWRAAQKAQLHTVPIVVRDVTDVEALEIALIENVQRADLNPIEEAAGYEQLMQEFGYDQNDLGRVIGKSRSHVANTLRLLKLPNFIKDFVSEGLLSAGHARALILAQNPRLLAQRAIDQGLSVRMLERLVQVERQTHNASLKNEAKVKDADTKSFEKRLIDATGLRIDLKYRGSGKGELRIEYKSLDELDAICRRLGA